MTRNRKQSSGRRRLAGDWTRFSARTSPPQRPTPVPPAELAARAGEVGSLVGELADLTGCGEAWSVRVLRRNVELALLNPGTLDRAENQLDFIEELAEAVWAAGDVGGACAAGSAVTAEEHVRREERRRALVARLNELTHGLCVAAEAWWELIALAGEAGPGRAVNPQEDHRS